RSERGAQCLPLSKLGQNYCLGAPAICDISRRRDNPYICSSEVQIVSGAIDRIAHIDCKGVLLNEIFSGESWIKMIRDVHIRCNYNAVCWVCRVLNRFESSSGDCCWCSGRCSDHIRRQYRRQNCAQRPWEGDDRRGYVLIGTANERTEV